MKKRLKKSLIRVIDEWMNSECESEDWLTLNIYVGDSTAEKMADAAGAVLEGIADIQEWLRKEEMLTK